MIHLDLMEFSMISILLPTIVGIVFYGKLNMALRLLVILLVVNLCFEVFAYILFLNKINNMLLFHFQTIIEFGLIAAIYLYIFKEKFVRQVIRISTPILMILGLINIYVGNFESINAIPRLVEGFMLILLFLSYLFIAIKNEKIPYLELSPYFILTSGFLIYFAGNVVLNFVSEELMESSLISIWTAHSLLNIMLNIVYTVVLWRGSRVSKLL